MAHINLEIEMDREGHACRIALICYLGGTPNTSNGLADLFGTGLARTEKADSRDDAAGPRAMDGPWMSTGSS